MKIDVKNVLHCAKHITDLALMAKIEVYEAVKLYQGLCRLETTVHRYNEDCCNIADFETDNPGKEKAFEKRLSKLFNGNPPAGFFINGDPRGYALKLNEPGKHYPDINIYQDWGGYGILAPSF